LNRVEEDASGHIFEEWDPTEIVDSSQMPAAMMINPSELRADAFTLREVFLHPQVDWVSSLIVF